MRPSDGGLGLSNMKAIHRNTAAGSAMAEKDSCDKSRSPWQPGDGHKSVIITVTVGVEVQGCGVPRYGGALMVPIPESDNALNPKLRRIITTRMLE
ncbi:hypothetical protein Tco_0945344 [Tanacetum coccineum]